LSLESVKKYFLSKTPKGGFADRRGFLVFTAPKHLAAPFQALKTLTK